MRALRCMNGDRIVSRPSHDAALVTQKRTNPTEKKGVGIVSDLLPLSDRTRPELNIFLCTMRQHCTNTWHSSSLEKSRE
jgi:hypothetical protein